MYGATMSDGGYFNVVDPQGAVLLPAEIEIGKTYKVSLQRYEYDYYNQYHGMGSSSIKVTVNRSEAIEVPAGTFTVYKFEIRDTWFDSWGNSGISYSAFWLADGVGWVRVERNGTIYDLQNYERKANPPSASRLSVKTAGTTLSLDWSHSSDADGYTFFYAPYPYQGPQTIGTLDIGDQTTASFDLFGGAAYYVAVEAYNTYGGSGLSNIEYFFIPYDLTVNPENLSVLAGQANTCNLNGGVAPYGARSDNTAVATVALNGGTISVTGVSEGSANISFFDNAGDWGTFPVSVTSDTVYDWATDLETAYVSGNISLLSDRLSDEYFHDGKDPNCQYSIYEYSLKYFVFNSAIYDIKSVKDISQDGNNMLKLEVEVHMDYLYIPKNTNWEESLTREFVVKLHNGKWKTYGNHEDYNGVYFSDFSTCNSLYKGKPKNIKSTFSSKDDFIYVYFQYGGLRKSTSTMYRYYTPSGKLQWEGKVFISEEDFPECSSGSGVAYLNVQIDGYETWWNNNIGTWKVQFFANNNLIETVYFEYY